MKLVLYRNIKKVSCGLFAVSSRASASRSFTVPPSIGKEASSDNAVPTTITSAESSNNDVKNSSEVDESLIQPEWLALEKRLSFRKPKPKGAVNH